MLATGRSAPGLVPPGRWLPVTVDLLSAAALAAVCLFLARTWGWLSPRPVAADTWLSLLLIAPVLEEIVFRGLLWRQLPPAWVRHRLGPISAHNGMCAIAFALSHWPLGGPLAAALVLVPGLMFGALRERHGALWPAIALHALFNALYLIAIAG